MKTKRILPLLALLGLWSALPAFGVSKEIVQLQTQVQALQDQMARMQQSFDERMGVMKNLIEQTTDNMNKVTAAVNNLQRTLTQQNSDIGGKVDQVSTQVQALHDSLDELRARLNKLNTQLDQFTAQQQNLPSQTPGANPAAAPPPDVLYNNGLRDYNSGKYDIAGQEFNDYLKFYASTDLAGNAQFYLGEIAYRQGNFQGAIQAYDTVLHQYPGGNKAAAAQLKKGFALLELGQRDAGVRELNSLIARYPRSVEATQARERLRQLSSRKTSPSRRPTAQ
ncbi:MAG TPA: tol-pal system protein YbgF [Terriglobales bacterium]|nr:tol-pal system protein YbgF [Terriglobales bacterium]